MFNPDYADSYEAFKDIETTLSMSELDEFAEPEFRGPQGQRIHRMTKQERQERKERSRQRKPR